MLGFSKSLKWGAAITIFAAVGPRAVVFKQPFIQISLQVCERSIQLFAESDLLEFILNGAVEPFTNAVGLRRTGFGLGMVDVFQRQIELIFVMLE